MKRRLKGTKERSEPTPEVLASGQPAWAVHCMHKAISALAVTPPLPPEWHSEPGPSGGPSTFWKDGSSHRTQVDPRFMPEDWRMTFDPRGNVIFSHLKSAQQTSIDPRGHPPSWRMQLEQSTGRPFWAHDELYFTTYVDPRGLPPGYEVRASGASTPQKVFFANHTTKLNAWKDPRKDVAPSTLKSWLERDLLAYIEAMSGAWLMSRPDAASSDSDETDEEDLVLPEPLCEAAHMGWIKPVREFLAAGGEVDARDAQMEGTMLMAAAACRHLDVLELLLDAGASVNIADAWGCTALSSACCSMDYQPFRRALAADSTPSTTRVLVVDRLLNARANVDAQDSLGLSALMVASISGEASCLKRLLQAGARRDLTEDNGHTALSLAETYGQHLAVKVLKQPHGAGSGGRRAMLAAAPAASAAAQPAADASTTLRVSPRELPPGYSDNVGAASTRRRKKGKRGKGRADVATAECAASADEAMAEATEAMAEGMALSAPVATSHAHPTMGADGAAALSRIDEDGVPPALPELTLGNDSGDGSGSASARAEDELYLDTGGASEAASSSDVHAAEHAVGDEQAEPEQELFCPLSHTLLTEAVMTSSGHLFNEGPLRQWLELHPGEDPLTRQPISEHLFPALAVRTMAERWAARGDVR